MHEVDGGSSSAYLWSLTPDGDYTWSATWTDQGAYAAEGVALTADRRVVVGLVAQGDVDFDPEPGMAVLASAGLQAVGLAWVRTDSGGFAP